MKARSFFAVGLIVSLALLLALVPGRTELTKAQGPQPPILGSREPHCPPAAPRGLEELHAPCWQKLPDSYWFMPKGVCPLMKAAGVSLLDTGGPDDFGYAWDDSVPLDWVDASNGTDTEMSGSSSGEKVGPISLPFSFKYYENTYTSLYIAASGYLGFTDEGYWSWQPRVPSPSTPNNMIAPYATPLRLATSGPTNRVYYKSGGIPPDRYFVVEWYQVAFEDETYTFEVILYENGDIVLQYQTMSYNDGYACGAAGIEDSMGLDGLAYMDWCRQAPSDKAVRFYRPAPSARVGIRPLYQGRFTHAGETATFQVPIRNTGELGADTYDLTTSSAWSVSLYAADGITPLTDTDGDDAVDTGSVTQGGSATVVVKVTTLGGANVGGHNTAIVTVRSSLDTGKSKTVSLQTAVPAPFAQVFRDNADGAMSLYLAQPTGQAVKKATSDWYYGAYMAMAAMPDSFAYFWSQYRWTGSVGTNEIEYTLLDRYGQTVRGVSKLTDHSGATMNTYDYYPAVAVAPNGRIGVLWRRYLWNNDTSQFDDNIHFAILDASGNLVYGPANLTNNNVWGTWSDYGVPRFYSPRITATGDNRFTLAWQRHSEGSEGSVSDIYYAARDTNGGEVKAITKFTTGVPGGNSYYNPALATLSGNRALLAYSGPSGISYAVLDSEGNTVKAETVTGGYGWGPDAVQSSSGNIVVAWSGSIEFAVLDSTTYNVVYGPIALSNPGAVTGDGYVSVVADADGHVILTWMDSDWDYRRNLYYALVDGDGNILTDPMIFRTSQATDPHIETSYEGYGNTSYSWTPSSDVDGMVDFGASLFGAPPGGNAAVSVRYANHGAMTATDAVLTATLDSNLAYVSDTLGIMPTVSGNDVVWGLPDLRFLDSQDFTLYIQVPSGAAYGTRYPVTLTLTSAGPEVNASDNIASAEVVAVQQVFLPLIFNNWPCIPSLISPEEGAVLDNGRTDGLDDIVWDFDWSDCAGATQYHLYVIHAGAGLPMIDDSNISSSSYHYVGHGYIIDQNRYNWTWKVRAKVDGQWGGWSGTRTFDVEPVNSDPSSP